MSSGPRPRRSVLRCSVKATHALHPGGSGPAARSCASATTPTPTPRSCSTAHPRARGPRADGPVRPRRPRHPIGLPPTVPREPTHQGSDDPARSTVEFRVRNFWGLTTARSTLEGQMGSTYQEGRGSAPGPAGPAARLSHRHGRTRREGRSARGLSRPADAVVAPARMTRFGLVEPREVTGKSAHEEV